MKYVVMIVIVLSLTGCYWRARVDETEVGLLMSNGIQVDEVVGVGRYTDMGWFADIVELDASAKTLIWADDDLITSDKQIVGFEVGITYRRGKTTDSALTMWNTYRMESQDDEALATQVFNRMARTMKEASAGFTLDQMLGTDGSSDTGRAALAANASDMLRNNLADIGVELLDLGINNISPSDSFRASLEAKAAAAIAVEVSQQRTLELKEQLEQEKAQTDIELEKARRDKEVAKEAAQVLVESPEAFEIKRLEALSKVIGGQDKIIFLPDGADISLFLSSQDLPPVIPKE